MGVDRGDNNMDFSLISTLNALVGRKGDLILEKVGVASSFRYGGVVAMTFENRLESGLG